MIPPTLGPILNSIGIELVGSAAAALLLKCAGKIMNHFKKNGPALTKQFKQFTPVGLNNGFMPTPRFAEITADMVNNIRRGNEMSLEV